MIGVFVSFVVDKVKVINDKVIKNLTSLLHIFYPSLVKPIVLLKTKEIENHALRSAVAAIMARNMSHQQGSAVIPYLLSLSGVSSVEEILKQYLFYIEQRMDFVATAATMEFPKWGISLKFFKDLIVGFISQYGLISSICKSEGYDYNNIRFKVFVKDDDKDLLSNKDVNEVNKKDVDVFIPGGLTGCHAFYLILENIMRNSAKYGTKKDNLEINIKLIDKETYYKVQVWDNVSTKTEKIDEFNKILKEPIITSTGEKRPYAWGFAEMRICAAYLISATEGEAAGELLKSQECPIKAIEINNTIGYVFKLNKPKLLEIYDGEGSS